MGGAWDTRWKVGRYAVGPRTGLARSCRLLWATACLVGLFGTVAAQEPGTLLTVAGGGTDEGEGIPAVEVALKRPLGVAVDSDGNIFIADTDNHRIRHVDAATGNITTVVGTGEPGFSGDGGPATGAQIRAPQAVAVDPDGNLYVADSGNRRIRRVDAATQTISTFSGTGDKGFSGDGGPAANAEYDEIVALLLDGRTALYVADGRGLFTGNDRLRRIDLQSGVIQTVAGSGSPSFSGEGVPATDAGMTVEGIALGGDGSLYIADFNNYRIRRADPATGTINTVVGRGPRPFMGGGGYAGDGGPATRAQLNIPTGVAVDSLGNIYFSDTGNNVIRTVDAITDTIMTLAGTGVAGVVGDGGISLDAELAEPTRLVLAPSGDLIIVDTGNNRIRRLVDPTFRTPLLRLVDPILDFRQVNVGEPITLPVRIQNAGSLDLTILGASSDNPDFTVEAEFPFTIGWSEDGGIPIRFSPVAEGIVDGILTVTTDDPRLPTLSITLKGTGSVPDIGVNPKELVYKRTLIGDERTLSVQISNLGVGNLLIGRISVTDTQFVVEFPDTIRISKGETRPFSVIFRPSRPDTQRAAITLFSNDPDDAAVDITLQGFGQIARPGGFADASDSLGVGDTGPAFGAAWGDYDGDGDPDLYVVRSLAGNLLYRNDPEGFAEVSATAGLDDEGDGSGAAWADYDSDGDLDLYVTNFGDPNRLYRNNGETFSEVAAQMGVNDPGDGYGAAWADYDRDGDPDLYVANFGTNRFYRNDPGGFVELAGSLGVADDGSTIQPAWADYDNDGDPDLFLANSGANRLFRNEGGTFTDVTQEIGLREDGPSFGAAWGDYDNDGDLDLFVPYFGEANRLFENTGSRFQDRASQLGVGSSGRGRGAVWGDFDNDGDLDLYVTNSGEPNLLYRNTALSLAGDGPVGFEEVADTLGVAINADSRGVALADFDTDGGLDLFVAVQDGPDRLLQNQEADGNWLVIRPSGTQSTRDAISARCEIRYAGGLRAIREITGGSSYLSQDALTAAFGLGFTDIIDTLTVRWPLGIIQRFVDVPVNRILDLDEAPPAPPARIQLTAQTPAIVANGQASTAITARILNAAGEVVLVGDLEIAFRLLVGDGFFVGADTVEVRDGTASILFQAGTNPGLEIVSARSGGLSGQVTIDLLAPLDTDSSLVRTVVGSDRGFSGDEGPATDARLNSPRDVAVDTSGQLYIADTENNRIRVVALDGTITTWAGNGNREATGTGGPVALAGIADPRGLALLPEGDLIVGEQSGHTVRRLVVATDTIEAFAGRGISGFGGDLRPAVNANLILPVGVAADRGGNVWIADQFNNRIRKVGTDGIITTVAGNGEAGYSGDNVSATKTGLSQPQGVAADSLGRIYIADTGNNRIRLVDLDGTITTVAGTGSAGASGDGGPGVRAELNRPRDVALDEKGHLFIADTNNHLARVLDLTNGLIQTVAGTGQGRFNGEEGPSLEISLSSPSGIAVGPTGAVFIADSGNDRIRELTVVFPEKEPPSGGGEDPADFNGDGLINFSDFVLFASAFGGADPAYDLDGDGVVAFGDFVRFASAFTRGASLGRPAFGRF
ncbi:MAG: FG-GAP-like repeat-containing protein [Candidatus Latescibacteria bacterium]|nr:FG-GAP-like repeat-containing protein [Candidatus Latescibacterota bacterium]